TNKLKVAGILLACGLFTGGTTMLALGQAAKRESAPVPTLPKAAGNTSLEQDLSTLARAKIEAAKLVRDDKYRLYLAGEIPITAYFDSQVRYTEAFLSVVAEREQRLSLLRQQLQNMTQIAEATTQLYQRNQVTRADVKLAEYYRIDAAIRLAEAQSGRR